jgi:hypothetical protein
MTAGPEDDEPEPLDPAAVASVDVVDREDGGADLIIAVEGRRRTLRFARREDALKRARVIWEARQDLARRDENGD